LQLIEEHIEKTFEYLEYYNILDKSIILFTSIPSENIQTEAPDKNKEFIHRRLNIPTIAYWQGNLKPETNKHAFFTHAILLLQFLNLLILN
jgi:arylsulfatase A-like enzyme